MATLRLRWSEHEAPKPYARPFMVTFVDDDGEALGSIAVNGSDLVYQRQFVVAVAALGGELFALEQVEQAADPQREWLDLLAPLLPPREVVAIAARSTFDAEHGRVFGFVVDCGTAAGAVVDARTLLDYQEFQAALAHQTGGLFRAAAVEQVDEQRPRQQAWDGWLRRFLLRPGVDDAMAPTWPWS